MVSGLNKSWTLLFKQVRDYSVLFIHVRDYTVETNLKVYAFTETIYYF